MFLYYFCFFYLGELMVVFLAAGILSILFGLICIWKPKVLAYIIGLYLIINGAVLLAEYGNLFAGM